MSNRISKRVGLISASPTMAMHAITQELKKSGKKIINMSSGEMNFKTPDQISSKGIEAIQEGKTKYTPASGMIELREAIVKKYRREYNVEFNIDEISVNSGAKNSLFNVFMSICNQGDEIILPTPHWVSYPEQIKLAEALPVVITGKEENSFKVTPKQLKEAISPKTKAFVLTTPNNPSGTGYTKEEILDLLQVLENKNIYLIFDEIYDSMTFSEFKHFSLAEKYHDFKDRIIIVNGHSKVYSMTGWRLGWTIAPVDVTSAIIKFQSHSLGGACTISQVAGITALEYYSDFFTSELEKRRDALLDGIERISEITCVKPVGAFYAFPNVSRLFGKMINGKKISNSKEFSEALLENALVSSIPGSAFGMDEHIRLAYAIEIKDIEMAVERIQYFVEQLN